MGAKIRSILEKSYFPIVAAIIGVALLLPSLDEGIFWDDLYHKSILTGEYTIAEKKAASFNAMFSCYSGKPEQVKTFKDMGFLPWWTYDELKLNFWRPVTELTHILDYKLWPETPWMMHLQSLLWLFLILIVVSILYKRINGKGWVAGFAILLFALDSSHGVPVSWIANRNSVLATFFGFCTILSHDYRYKNNWKPGFIISPILLGFSLLSTELGASTCAFLFSYIVFIEKNDLKEKIISLLPYALVVILWRTFYNLFDYGVVGSGFYIDPVATPFDFIKAVFQRWPVLFLAQFFGPSASMFMFFSESVVRGIVIFGYLFIPFFLYLIYPVLKTDRKARFWILGFALSILPLCASGLHDRLLILASIGGFGVISLFFQYKIEQPELFSKTFGLKIISWGFIVFFIFIHIVLSPLGKLKMSEVNDSREPVIDSQVNNKHLTVKKHNQILIVINPADSYLSFLRIINQKFLKKEFNAKYFRGLASSWSDLTIKRTDDRSLEIFAEKGYFSQGFDTLFRGKHNPMKIGQEVTLAGLTVKILSLTKSGFPQNVKFTFEKPLEDSDYRFVCWKNMGYEPYKLPGIGEINFLPKLNTDELLKKLNWL
ncbi:hypothetical protein [Desulfobacter curvatus]|uniref:hypothetical protein n=1 Tax=Desulfobacter curvatus TaxID=2290 RepID=UPI000376E512|nr:hypothetical protein [Desulfobacter curvatus]